MTRLVGLIVAMTLFAASPAAAQAPSADAYGGASRVLDAVGTAPITTVGSDGSSTGAGDGSVAPGGSNAAGGGRSGTVAGESGVATDGPTIAPVGGATPTSTAGKSSVATAAATGASGNGAGTTAAAEPSRPIANAGSLPFTGLDLGLLMAGSLVLIGVGLGLRRLSNTGAPSA